MTVRARHVLQTLILGLGFVACNQNGKPPRTAMAENAADAQRTVEEAWGPADSSPKKDSEKTKEQVEKGTEQGDQSTGESSEDKNKESGQQK